MEIKAGIGNKVALVQVRFLEKAEFEDSSTANLPEIEFRLDQLFKGRFARFAVIVTVTFHAPYVFDSLRRVGR